jgi:hypothetical protein
MLLPFLVVQSHFRIGPADNSLLVTTGNYTFLRHHDFDTRRRLARRMACHHFVPMYSSISTLSRLDSPSNPTERAPAAPEKRDR